MNEPDDAWPGHAAQWMLDDAGTCVQLHISFHMALGCCGISGTSQPFQHKNSQQSSADPAYGTSLIKTSLTETWTERLK